MARKNKEITMERVSFKVAKALKKADYPQDIAKEEYLFDINGNPSTGFEQCEEFVRPTYIEVWFWLWREKKMTIDVVALAGNSCGTFIWKFGEHLNSQINFEDPEESITAAIEFIVDNDLLK